MLSANLTGQIMTIEDTGNHPDQALAQLRSLLAQGAVATADPKRDGFYEVEGDSTVYYIHITPVTGKVLLLATWGNDRVPAAGAV